MYQKVKKRGKKQVRAKKRKTMIDYVVDNNQKNCFIPVINIFVLDKFLLTLDK